MKNINLSGLQSMNDTGPGDAKSNALEALKLIGSVADQIGLQPYEILGALREDQDKWSGFSIYLEVQSYALRFAGTVGATVIFLTGLGFILGILANSTSKMYTWLTSHLSMLGSLFGKTENKVLGWFGFGSTPGKLNDATADAGAFMLAVQSIAPGPLGFVVSAIQSAVGGSISGMTPPASLSLPTAGGSSAATAPATAAAATPATAAAGATNTAAAATAAASGGNSLASEISAGTSAASGLSSLIGSLTSSSSAASTVGSAASTLSSAADSTDSSTLTSSLDSLDDGTDASSVASDLSLSDAVRDGDPRAAISTLKRTLGPAGAAAALRHILSISLAHRR